MIIFAWALVVGIAICVLYGIFGGDEALKEKHPILTEALHWAHHWWIGLIAMAIGTVIKNEALLGFGTGLFIDYRIYHSLKD